MAWPNVMQYGMVQPAWMRPDHFMQFGMVQPSLTRPRTAKTAAEISMLKEELEAQKKKTAELEQLLNEQHASAATKSVSCKSVPDLNARPAQPRHNVAEDGFELRFEEKVSETVRGSFKTVTIAWIQGPSIRNTKCAVGCFSNVNLLKIQREVGFLKRCNHDHIVKLIHYFEDAVNNYTNPTLAMELVEPLGCDLLKVCNGYVYKDCYMPLHELECYFEQMVDALMYLHSVRIMHRDVHDGQFLIQLDYQDRTDPGVVKLCDLGEAISFEELYSVPTSPYYWPVSADADHAAPELKQKRPYDAKVDAWGLGWILGRFYKALLTSGQERLASQNMKEAWECLSKESADERWGIADLKNSKWLTQRSRDAIGVPHLLNENCSEFALAEIQRCEPFGELMKFSDCFRAFVMTMPIDFQPRHLKDLSLDGHSWCLMFVWRADRRSFEAANRETIISALDRIIFGANDLTVVKDALSISDWSMRTTDGVIVPSKIPEQFALELDCFVFSSDLVHDGKVLGGKVHARKVGFREDQALDLRSIYDLSIAGVGIPERDGSFRIEWTPEPTFVVLPGYLGIVSRVPLSTGRTMRAKQFSAC